MRICATSDLHGQLPRVEPCDLLLIAGDVCPTTDHSLAFRRRWIDRELSAWMLDSEQVPAKRIVWIGGNHDFSLELGGPGRRFEKTVARATYLRDQGVEVGGLHIWGSPWSVELGRWAFGLPDFAPPGQPSLESAFAQIPENVDVVVVHGPPRGVGDLIVDGRRVGSQALWRHLLRVEPRLVITGHVHEDFGCRASPWGGLIWNVSLLDEAYRPVRSPVLIDL